MTDEISLKEFIEIKFNHLNDKMEDVAKEVCGLRKKYDEQQTVHVNCLARQSKERGEMWCAIDELGRQQANANGFERGKAHALERVGWDKYIDWVKIGAIGAILAVVATILVKLL